ncbi:hypothetical protein [Paenarthrobacter nicotinovorans]|uniref:hypothetical protein n=1 Tax=Paenarthrobacter nicotinovorans TaxID=29320 RepID=UPI0012E76BEC|nr:hypothetical protein [Paenarthrobacter nicotinovorans]
MKPLPRGWPFANLHQLVVAGHGFVRCYPVGTLAGKRSEGPRVYARCLKLLDEDS